MLASVAPALSTEVMPLSIGLKRNKDEDLNLDTIFENMTSTSCGHCCSVLSPSAYMVELLEFLRLGRDPGRVLNARRPDIANLELSCANTNTEIPYVDLVNEVLESYLYYTRIKPPSTGPLPLDTHNHTDDVLSPEILAEPQNINDMVYELLKEDVTPIGILPFDRNLEQVRTLLDKSETSRSDVLKLFGDESSPRLKRALVAEELGMTEAEYTAITGEKFAPEAEGASRTLELYDYWGFDSHVDMLSTYGGISRLRSQFLPRTGYTFDQVVELLRTEFINGPELPRELLGASVSLDTLWSQVSGTSDENDTLAKYGGLLRALTGEDWVQITADNQGYAHTLISSFIRLPSLITITPISDDGSSSSSPRRVSDPHARWWMTGKYYYGTEDEVNSAGDDPFFVVNSDGGMVSQSSGMEGYVDEVGQFLVNDTQPIYSLDKLSDTSRHLWCRHPQYGIIGKLTRSGNTNGELLIVSSNGTYRELGPASASEASGWCWTPLEQNGEPQPSLLALRQLSGQPVSLTQWGRIHGFVRLQKKIGWSIADMDLVLQGLKATRIGPDVLEKLAFVKSLQKATRMGLGQIISLVQGLSIRQYKSIFLKPGLLKSNSVFALDVAGRPRFESAQADSTRLLDYCVPVAAAFGVSPPDIMTTITSLQLTDTTLSMDSISNLYRHVLL